MANRISFLNDKRHAISDKQNWEENYGSA
jgi:hypothetical protein